VRRYWAFVVGLMVVLLLLFTVVEALEIEVLVDPSPWLATASLAAAAIGVGLLVVDVLLPVPSSLVMIALGSLFGFWLGGALAFVGMVAAGVFGFWIGRRGAGPLSRAIGPDERDRADRLLSRWGPLAIALTRAVPILAETTAILAGASRVRWSVAFAALVVGSIPVALAFAAIGSAANNAVK
jgi:uncharacterized membrane protein YdjX (TVP38/TMEM64 family)